MDIALAPLERNNIFCRAKSEIKFVEAGALGVPVIASRVDAYCDAITDGVNGYLASNETEWVAALRSLIQDRSLRLRMGQAALLTVRDRYGSAARTGDLQRLLTKLGSDLGK
jgi:glycosyltransferase involved in cell wall biosynthesis